MSRAAKRIIGGAALATGLTAASYPALLRHRCLTWGATPDEVARRLPGDELLTTADIVSTRAVTIDAPSSAIWPWLVQMGSGRGGAYTYDWIENLLGLGMHSADEILPQFQNLKVGDEMEMGPNRPKLRVEVLDPERVFTIRFEDGNWVWIFALFPEAGATRLVSRNRIATPDASPLARLVNLMLMEPGSLVMERKMLLGIKQRAERLASASAVEMLANRCSGSAGG
ncbi:MAG: hypothetical protein QOJ31_532 [Gaiellales bacterium]|jgi:hypothetical protein|nr:hypothetical protein [Gaiellales bacterium]MDX6549848.1 hypothetical protein [Gaiellales bacterium]